MAVSEPRATHIRHCLLFLFDKGTSPNDAWHEINNVYGERTVSKPTCVNWFYKFRSGDRSLFRLKKTEGSAAVPVPGQMKAPPLKRKKKKKKVDVIQIKEEERDVIMVKDEPEEIIPCDPELIVIKDEPDIAQDDPGVIYID